MNVFRTFYDTIFTPKEWVLSKKGPKEGEKVARGHFHERVGETPVHWLNSSAFKYLGPFRLKIEQGTLVLLCSGPIRTKFAFHKKTAFDPQK